MASRTRAAKKIDINGFGVYLSEIVDEYNSDVMKVSKEEAEKAAASAVDGLRERSPKSAGKSKHGRHYANTWGVSVIKDSPVDWEYVVHNPANYQLTHLLEHGHAIKNGTARCRPGFVKGIPHIKPIADKKCNEYFENVERRVKGGA